MNHNFQHTQAVNHSEEALVVDILDFSQDLEVDLVDHQLMLLLVQAPLEVDLDDKINLIYNVPKYCEIISSE